MSRLLAIVTLLAGCTARPALLPPPLGLADDVRAEREAQLEAARAAWEADPDDVDAITWYGRRLAYLGRYADAIDVYSEGLRRHPDSPHLLRHRGHRFITMRRFDDAAWDLARAAVLVADRPDEVEPDGMPNAQGVPRSTLKTNIHYHLGLARYLRGDHAAAARAWRRGLDLAPNDDMDVATRYWLHLALRRAGREDEAALLLEPVRPDMDVIENHEYHRLLRLFRGDIDPGAVPGEGDDVSSATTGYGLAQWHRFRGDETAMRRALRRVVDNGDWAAFGRIAAEGEVQ